MRPEAEALSDSDLVASAAAGDRASFERLVGRWWARMGAYAASAAAGDPELAEEIAQDALCRLHGSLRRFRGDSSFGTYLYRICRIAAADAIRRRARERRRLDRTRGESWEDSLPSPLPGPEAAAEADDEAAALGRALARLGEEARSLVYLKEAEGLGVSELARIFGLREGTVKSRLSRARAALRELLGEEGYGTD